MATGNVTLNGITDANLVKILEVKSKKSAHSMFFQPQQMQPIPAQTPQQSSKPQKYNNAIIGFGDHNGLEGVIEILKHLHEEKAG